MYQVTYLFNTVEDGFWLVGWQFYRSFPGPPDVTERDMYLLVTKYRDPENDGLVNYLNLHHDVMAISQLLNQGKGLPIIPTRNVDFAPHVVSTCHVLIYDGHKHKQHRLHMVINRITSSHKYVMIISLAQMLSS